MRKQGTYLMICAGICAMLAGCSGNAAKTTAAAEATAAQTTAEASAGEEGAETESAADETNAGAPAENGPDGAPNAGPQVGDRDGGANNRLAEETDPEILAVIAEGADKFQQLTYQDEESGSSLEYSLFIPQDYNEQESYPLLMYIPDASASGKSAKEIVQQYYGADIWVSEEEQQKHPSFILVPAFSGTVVDDNWNTSDQIETAVKLLNQITAEYSIDTNRIYTTGQSMGCMTSLYLNSKYPDLFAASLFVSGQWDISVLKGLENETFFYITAGGDEKASGGQDEVMAMFDEDGVGYSYGQWSAQDSAADQDAAAQALIAQGNKANMIRFEKGSVLKDGNSMEHMASFNYAYKIEAVRDWLFAQSK